MEASATTHAIGRKLPHTCKHFVKTHSIQMECSGRCSVTFMSSFHQMETEPLCLSATVESSSIIVRSVCNLVEQVRSPCLYFLSRPRGSGCRYSVHSLEFPECHVCLPSSGAVTSGPGQDPLGPASPCAGGSPATPTPGMVSGLTRAVSHQCSQASLGSTHASSGPLDPRGSGQLSHSSVDAVRLSLSRSGYSEAVITGLAEGGRSSTNALCDG